MLWYLFPFSFSFLLLPLFWLFLLLLLFCSLSYCCCSSSFLLLVSLFFFSFFFFPSIACFFFSLLLKIHLFFYFLTSRVRPEDKRRSLCSLTHWSVAVTVSVQSAVSATFSDPTWAVFVPECLFIVYHCRDYYHLEWFFFLRISKPMYVFVQGRSRVCILISFYRSMNIHISLAIYLAIHLSVCIYRSICLLVNIFLAIYIYQ